MEFFGRAVSVLRRRFQAGLLGLVWVLLVVSCGLVSAAQAQQQPSAQPLQVLKKHVRVEVLDHRAALVSHVPDGQQFQGSIVLPLRNQAALTSLLGRLYDPAGPEYRHFLSVAQFTEQFGPTQADFQAVVAFAQANGLTVGELPANRLLVPFSGSTAQVNAAFHVQMNVYQHPTENRTFFSPDREPSLALSVPVSHIAGLNNFAPPRHISNVAGGVQPATVLNGSGPGGSYLGNDMRAAYYGGTTLDGNGQAVGILEFGG